MLQALISKLSQLGWPSFAAGADARRIRRGRGRHRTFRAACGRVASGSHAGRRRDQRRERAQRRHPAQEPAGAAGPGPQLPSAEKINLPRHCREELGIAYKSVAAVRDFFGELEDGAAGRRGILRGRRSNSEPRRRLSSTCRQVAARWRCLSLRALTAVVVLEKDVARCLPGRYSHNTPLLKKLLRSVIDGGRPCVDDNATVKLPDLPQRRAAVRPNVHLPCVLEYHGRTYQAVAKDISTGGVGFEEAPLLEPQAVVLWSSKAATALPAWWCGARVPGRA